MLKLGRVTEVKVLFLVMIFVFIFGLIKFSAAILEKGLFGKTLHFVLSSLREITSKSINHRVFENKDPSKHVRMFLGKDMISRGLQSN